MAYRVSLETRARREFLDLPEKTRETISDAIDDLTDNPRPPGSKKIVGRNGYRIRKGDYRVLYAISDSERMERIYRIGHRREIYRGL